MAFVTTDDNNLARDMWPGNKGRIVGDTATAATLPRSRLVPRDFDGLSRWMCVDPGGIDTATTAWTVPDADTDEPSEVTIRLQGFVERTAIGMIGNWNGNPQGAPKAMQTLTLASGGCGDAFDPQLRALQNVAELVATLLSRDVTAPKLENGKIVLKRRVFQKVRPNDADAQTFDVPFAEDPVGRARKMEHMWAIRHRIDAGIQGGDGRIRRVNPLAIRVGDFVDVAMTIHAVSLRLNKGRRTVEIMFAPQAIVRLLSPVEAMILLKTVAEESEFMEGEAAVVPARRENGFTFLAGDEMEDA